MSLPVGAEFKYFSNFTAFISEIQSNRLRITDSLHACASDLRRNAAPFSGQEEELMEWASELMDDALDRVDSSLNEPLSMTLNVSKPPSKDTLQEERRPQALFHDPVDNRNFNWRPWIATGPRPQMPPLNEMSRDDGTKNKVHPLAMELEALRYSSCQLEAPMDPVPQPRSLDATPFLFVDDESTLAQMTCELSSCLQMVPSPSLDSHPVLAIDLENHSYHSFSGFTSLIQMSTREKDYVIDPLVPLIRSKIGPALFPFLTQPSIVKIVHGSDRDIEWLQRDFGLYIVNSFDTGQAARVLSLPSAGLAFLLETFCCVLSDKRFQLADWRIRPLTAEMVTYARTDTHYLIYIYDRLRAELLSLNPSQVPIPLASSPSYADDPELADDVRKVLKGALGCVLERSRQLCLNLYERETIGPDTAVEAAAKWGLRLNPMQLGVFCSLFEWRDKVCRAEDESCGYLLSKALLTIISQEMPGSLKELKRVMGRSANQLILKRSSEVLAAILDGKSRPREMRNERKVPQLIADAEPAAAALSAAPSAMAIKPKVVAPLIMKSSSGMFNSGSGAKQGTQGTSRPPTSLNALTNTGVLSRSFITSLASMAPPLLPTAMMEDPESHPPVAASGNKVTSAEEAPQSVESSQVRAVMEGLISSGSKVVTLDARGQQLVPLSNNPYLLPAAPKGLNSRPPDKSVGMQEELLEFVPIPLSEMKREERKGQRNNGLRDPLRKDQAVVAEIKRKYLIGTDAPRFGGEEEEEEEEEENSEEQVVRGRGGSLLGGKKKSKRPSVPQSDKGGEARPGSSSFKAFDYEAAGSKQLKKEKQGGKPTGKSDRGGRGGGKGKRSREKAGPWSPDVVDGGGVTGGIRGGKRQRNTPAHGNKSRTFGTSRK